MEGYQWIHPAVAITTFLRLAGTAYAKMGPKTYFKAHYALATATVVGMLVSFGLAVYAVVRCDCRDDWPASLYIHIPAALLLTGFILGQATMGVTMRMIGRKPRLLRAHRRNARVVLGLATVVLLLGIGNVVLMVAA